MNKTLLLLLVLFSLSCVSKKKTIEEEKQKIEATTETETKKAETQATEEKENTVSKVDSTSEKNEITVTDIKEKDLDIEADDGGEVTVTEEKTATGTKTTFSGVKNVRVRDKTTNETKSLRERISLLKQDSINWVKKDSLNLVTWQTEKATLISEYEKRLKDKDEKIGSGWFWWFVGSAGLNVLLILWINRKRIARLTRGSPV